MAAGGPRAGLRPLDPLGGAAITKPGCWTRARGGGPPPRAPRRAPGAQPKGSKGLSPALGPPVAMCFHKKRRMVMAPPPPARLAARPWGPAQGVQGPESGPWPPAAMYFHKKRRCFNMFGMPRALKFTNTSIIGDQYSDYCDCVAETSIFGDCFTEKVICW